MIPSDHQRRRYAILRDLLDLEPAAREAALAARSTDEPDLAAELRQLLDLTEAGVLDRDAAGLAAELADGGDDALAPGTAIGGWRVLRALGAGGMGSVHLVERAGDGYVQQGALKLIKRGMDSGELVARFRRERGILSRLNHPNIARLLDGGIAADGRSFLVMEFVDGETLDAWSQGTPGTRAKRIELFLALCAAVAHAHHQLIVHRDIKPGNVMVTRDGEPRLLDFGIAKVLADDDADSTRTLHGPVSRAYAAPEQLGSGIVTTATDIYQLGLLLRHLFTDDATHGDLAVVLARATDAEPARRYATVEALAEDVRRWRDGRPILARADSAGYRLRRFVARHRLAVALAALAMAGLLGGSTVALWQAQRAEREATLARAAQAFLTSVFDAAAPDAEAGARVTVRELIDRGVDRVDDDLADQPQLRAEMLLTLGTLYRQLGQYDAAAATLTRAVDAGGTANLRARIELASTERERERLDAALTLLDAVLIEDLTAAERARALGERAQLADKQGRLEAALADASAAVRLDAGRAAEGRADFARDRRIEATVLTRLGRFDEATAAFEEAIASTAAMLGSDDTRVAAIRSDYGGMLLSRSLPADSERELRLALDVQRRRLGAHPALAQTLQVLGGALRQQGRPDAANDVLREALAIQRATLGERHGDLANTLNSLAILALTRGRYADAEADLRETLAIQQAQNQGSTLQAGIAATNLAVALMRQGKLDEAAARLDEAAAILHATVGDEHPANFNVENTRAQLAVRRGDAAAGVVHARNAVRLATTALKPGRDAAAIRLTLAGALLRAGDAASALAEARDATEMLEAAGFGNDPRHLFALAVQADALAALGDGEAAWLLAVRVRDAQADAPALQRVPTHALLARAARARGDAAEAARQRKLGHELLATVESPDPELAADLARD